jgi:hypothetical protein
MLELLGEDFKKKYIADFTHWIKMSYWTLDEGVALLLGLNPKRTYWDLMKEFLEGSHANPFAGFYSDLRDIVLRAQEAHKITDPVSPLIFVEWATSVGIGVPQSLQEQVAIMKNIKTPVETETDKLLEEIAALQKKIEVLEASVWSGLDEKESTYSKELAIAVNAHNAVSKSWKKSKNSIKQQHWVWLEENHPELLKEEKIRISKICNWQKKGGAPVTP